MRIVSILLFLSFVLPIQTGQPYSAQRHERVSLEIGAVTVWLGMSKEQALKKFADVGQEVVDTGDGVLVKVGGDSHDLRFKNGRLVYADREWYTGDKPDESDAVLGALRALAEKSEENGKCSVIYSPLSQPNWSAERVFVWCGNRSVLIIKSKYQDRRSLGVTERIGDIPPSTQE